MTRIAATPDLLPKLNGLTIELAKNGLHLVSSTSQPGNAPDCLLITGDEQHLLSARPKLCPIIVVAEQGSIPEAVSCVKAGAADYLTLPLDTDALLVAVEQALSTWVLQAPLGTGAIHGYELIGTSAAMRDLLHRLERAGGTDAPVLLLGEVGTGKELAARALHAMSLRRQSPLLTLNCAAIPNALIEAELFGTAGTAGSSGKIGLLQAAEGGTVFLDEIGALPEASQARLLQVLEAGTLRASGSSERRLSNIRILAASHRPLEPLAERGQFRKDLLYRLNGFPIVVPPLRERGNDILLLAERFLRRTSERLGKEPSLFSESAKQRLVAYQWPGNVRELENAVERAVILCNGSQIEASELAIETPPRYTPATAAVGRGETQDSSSASIAKLESAGEDTSLETYFLNFVLEHQDQFTETELAERLGISRKSLWERRQRLNIPRKRTRKRGPRRDRA